MRNGSMRNGSRRNGSRRNRSRRNRNTLSVHEKFLGDQGIAALVTTSEIIIKVRRHCNLDPFAKIKCGVTGV